MSANPAAAMAVAPGTTALCPLSSTRFETRGATKIMHTAMSEATLVASSAPAPDSVSVVMVPMVIVYENRRMNSVPMSNRYAWRVRKMAEYALGFKPAMHAA